MSITNNMLAGVTNQTYAYDSVYNGPCDSSYDSVYINFVELSS